MSATVGLLRQMCDDLLLDGVVAFAGDKLLTVELENHTAISVHFRYAGQAVYFTPVETMLSLVAECRDEQRVYLDGQPALLQKMTKGETVLAIVPAPEGSRYANRY